ncbi:MAG TPA: hypothetical protein VFS43_42605 [Polyangiaceae bacterium]|nr:hypothetical protein [Polyangiaceae bacterium]
MTSRLRAAHSLVASAAAFSLTATMGLSAYAQTTPGAAPPSTAAQPLPPPAAQPLPPSAAPPPPPGAAPTTPPGAAPPPPGAMPPPAPPPGAMPPPGAAPPPGGDPGMGTAPLPTGPAADAPMAPPPPSGENAYLTSRVPAYVAFGVAGAGLIVGTVAGFSALSAKSDYDDRPTFENAEKVENRSALADVGFGAFVVAGITGALFFLAGDSSSSASPPPPAAGAKAGPRRVGSLGASKASGWQLAPIVSQRSQGAAFTLRF